MYFVLCKKSITLQFKNLENTILFILLGYVWTYYNKASNNGKVVNSTFVTIKDSIHRQYFLINLYYWD